MFCAVHSSLGVARKEVQVLNVLEKCAASQGSECNEYYAVFEGSERWALDLDADELAQMVRIKLWHVLKDREVVYLKPYIRRIINSEFIDMLRRRKPTQPLPEDIDGEISMGKVIAAASEGIADPAEVIEEQEEAECRMEEIVDAVLELPRRQQHVMICTMQDRVDDPVPLIHALQSRQQDIRAWQWPQKKQDKQLLMASLSYARRNLAASLASVS